MKYLYSLLWLCTVFFFSCNGGLPDAEETEGEIEIFPDYKGVAVPCNIAPLNFKLKEPCEAIALFSGKDQQIRVNSDNGSFQIPEKKWRRLLDASVGGNLTVGIYICKDSRTRPHTDGFQRNNAKCLDEKGISRFVPHSSF